MTITIYFLIKYMALVGRYWEGSTVSQNKWEVECSSLNKSQKILEEHLARNSRDKKTIRTSFWQPQKVDKKELTKDPSNMNCLRSILNYFMRLINI